MDAVMEALGRCGLFAGLTGEELEGLLACLGARTARYPRGADILGEGDPAPEVGVLAEGRGRAVKWDPSGRLVTITLLGEGSEIGALLAACPGRRSPVTVQALEDAVVVWLPFERIAARCGRGCPGHARLLGNYLSVTAQKGLELHQRLDCLLRPTVREKILACLGRFSREQGGGQFLLPMDRGGMAEYLNVERSALSRELSRMRRDGLVEYRKNVFWLF